MKLWECIDPFFDKQPEREFVKELMEPLHISAPERWNCRECRPDEVSLGKGVEIVKEFDDHGGLLDNAYKDFESFLRVSGIPAGNYPIRILYTPTECFEAYKIKADSEGCSVLAADTEGIRRALVFLEDEMLRREGPFLPQSIIERKPFIKSRITRCFFSPTNRPPKNGDELSDDVDYYPDEYLNRLAHEGINGVWIYTHFRDLLPSEIIPEYGKNSRQRIDKLNRTIEKCAKYGIKVYVFGVEPASTYRNPILKEKHEELLGNKWGEDFYALCTGTEKGLAYAEESTKTLFTLSPELAGLIIITVGESCSNCASADMVINCPHCKGKPPKEILAQAVAALERGIHSVKPEAEFISWPYGQRSWGKENAIEAAECVPENVILMHNFEDLGEEEQLGRKRIAIDYWLSYVGPSEMFEESAKKAKSVGRRVFAKLQVCCSHEVASIPYVPVPGILYKKYKAMRELGVDGAVQCWYFGNYPSLMGKAAGELSFEPFFEDEDSFLKHLAGIYWGSKADKVVDAWKYFEKGYRNFPINVAFDWYGPMHDAPVWPLQLIPKNLPLAGTWLTYDCVGGDRIGECMLLGHDLNEAVTLCEGMSGNWKKGAAILNELKVEENYNREVAHKDLKLNECVSVGTEVIEDKNKLSRFRTKSPVLEQISVANALDCQFESGFNVLRFYMLREMLGLGKGDAKALVEEMRAIVNREIDISFSLIKLCKADKRLGYHSEGEGFKYFPEKLEWRIGLLRELLKTEFLEVEDRINKGLIPLEYYSGMSEKNKRYTCNDDIELAELEEFIFENGSSDQKTRWSAALNNGVLHLRILCKELKTDDCLEIRPEFRLMWPYPPLTIKPDGTTCFDNSVYYYSLTKEMEMLEKEKWQIRILNNNDEVEINILLRLKDFGVEEEMNSFRLNIIRRSQRISKWVFSEFYTERLIFGEQYHDEFGWIIKS